MKRPTKWLRLLALFGAFAMFAAACGDSSESSDTGTDADAGDDAGDDGGTGSDFTVAIVARADDYGNLLGNGLVDGFEAEDVATELITYDPQNLSADTVGSDVAAASPDATVFVSFSEGAGIIAAAIEEGLDPATFYGADGLFSPTLPGLVSGDDGSDGDEEESLDAAEPIAATGGLGDEMVIPIIYPQTGDLSFLGAPQRGGADLAVEDWNATDAPFTLTLEAFDEGDDAATVGTAAEGAIAASNGAIVGAAASGQSQEIIQPINDAGFLQCSGSNTSDAFTSQDNADRYVRTVPGDAAVVPVIVATVLADLTGGGGDDAGDGVIDGMKVIGAGGSADFNERLDGVMPAEEAGNFIYGGQFYECFVGMALAAMQKGDFSIDEADFVEVYRGGEKCGPDVQSCVDLIAAGTEIDRDGVAGAGEHTDVGDPTQVTYSIAEYQAGAMVPISEQDVDVTELG